MLNIRYREKTTAWPGFVDLFSNLVIILIFLLIVFVFLWTTTSVFNKSTGLQTITELKNKNQEQMATIKVMQADSEEAKRLLVLARTEVENLDSQKSQLSSQLANTNTQLQQIDNEKNVLNSQLEQANENLAAKVTQYEAKIIEMEQMNAKMQQSIANLNTQLASEVLGKQETQKLEQDRKNLHKDMEAQRAKLMQEILKLQAALDASELKAKEQEVQYVEMSSRLNKALTDKIAELNSVTGYQSAFYKSVKTALGDESMIQPNGDRFTVSSDILFATGEYKLTNAGKKQIALISNVIKNMENEIPTNIDWIIRVDGHTDKQPVLRGNKGFKNNTELSLLRATAVTDELVKNGVSKRRLLPSGFGELHPAALGTDSKSMQQNRRIELQLTNK